MSMFKTDVLKFSENKRSFEVKIYDGNEIICDTVDTCRESILYRIERAIMRKNVENIFKSKDQIKITNSLIKINEEKLTPEQENFDVKIRYHDNNGLRTKIHLLFMETILNYAIKIANPNHQKSIFKSEYQNTYYQLALKLKYINQPCKLSFILGIFRQGINCLSQTSETDLQVFIDRMKQYTEKIKFGYFINNFTGTGSFYPIDISTYSILTYAKFLSAGTIFDYEKYPLGLTGYINIAPQKSGNRPNGFIQTINYHTRNIKVNTR